MEEAMAQPDRYDILVLGSGTGGKLVAWQMGRAGRRTAVVERKWIGGSCPNIACMPSKNEISSARVAHLVRGVRLDASARRDRHGSGSQAQARHGRRPGRTASRKLQGEWRRVNHGFWSVCRAKDDRGAIE